MPQAIAYRSDQRFRGYRLRQYTREVVEIEVGGVAAGDNDDGDVAGGVVSRHLAADVLAAQPRQAQVENDGAYRLFFDSLQCVDAVVGSDNNISLKRQHAAVERPKRGIVFDDQNRRLATCGGHDRSVEEYLPFLKLYGCGFYCCGLVACSR